MKSEKQSASKEKETTQSKQQNTQTKVKRLFATGKPRVVRDSHGWDAKYIPVREISKDMIVCYMPEWSTFGIEHGHVSVRRGNEYTSTSKETLDNDKERGRGTLIEINLGHLMDENGNFLNIEKEDKLYHDAKANADLEISKYDVLTLNCADITIRFLKKMGYLDPKENFYGVTRPKEVALKVCDIALRNINLRRMSIIKKFNNHPASLSELKQLINNDIERLKIESCKYEIEKGVSKNRFTPMSQTIAVLHKLITSIEGEKADFSTDNQEAIYKKLWFRTKEVDPVTANNLKQCLSYFPSDLLENIPEKRAFLNAFFAACKGKNVLKELDRIKVAKLFHDTDLSTASSQAIQLLFYEVKDVLMSSVKQQAMLGSSAASHFYQRWSNAARNPKYVGDELAPTIELHSLGMPKKT